MPQTIEPVAKRTWTGAVRVLLVLTLFLIYWVVVVPLGLVMRVIGVDLMRRRLGRGSDVKTYRIEARPRRFGNGVKPGLTLRSIDDECAKVVSFTQR